MKKAFTLIELLVVIAIIAILAAILFPVFAQAKTAAKKTAAISNQKQISLGLVMYVDANDDQYPRRRGCEAGTSLNSALNDGGAARCGGARGFGDSMTWQTWQKYVLPYTKSVQIFFHPLREKNATEWTTNGQILGGFVLNLGVSGVTTSGFVTEPWFGGAQSGLPNVSQTMVLMEMANTYAVPAAVSNIVTGSQGTDQVQRGFPMAVREYWEAQFFTPTGTACGVTNVPDKIGTGPHEGVVMGMGDGSAKFINYKAFLSNTPRLSEYIPSASLGTLASKFNGNCRRARSVFDYGTSTDPNTSINYPMWGLGGQ